MSSGSRRRGGAASGGGRVCAPGHGAARPLTRPLAQHASRDIATKTKPGQGVFFFLWPLFARAPRHWFLENFLLSAPGVQSVFFCCAPLGAATFRRGKKKNTTQGVFFFAPAPGKGKGRRSPVGRRHGARAKKKHHPGCFFAAAPAKSKRRRSPVGRRHGARAKKKTPPRVFFFLLRPRGKAGEGEAPLGAGTGPEQKVFFFFLLWPRAGAQRGFSFPCLSPGPEQKKKTPWVVFLFLLWPRAGAQRGFSFACFSPGPQQKKTPSVVFFFALAPCRRPTGLLLPLPFAGAAAKKKPPWVVFFLLLRPRADAHSLTAGLGGDASPSPGWCFFFFFAAAPPGPGWCFFFCCGPARTLTHSRWAGAISARPGWCFFVCCGPAGSF